jgi:hypothetical protein
MCLGEKNIGDIDRVVRIIVGVALLYAIASDMVAPPLSYLAALLMLGMFFTVAAGTCALYSMLGISTCAVKPKPAAKKAAKKGRKK